MRQLLLIVYIYLVAVTAYAQASDDLFKAIRAQDAATVSALLEKDPALAASTSNGLSATTTALFLIRRGFIDVKKNEILHLVLDRKPPLDLHETAALGTAEELARMLPAGSVDVPKRGWTPLHFAAFAGNVETAKLLIDRGADVNLRAKTKFLNTPLLVASLTGQLDVARLLLDRGADILVRQAKGFTPLQEAALVGNLDLVKLYLERGAELNSRTDDGRTALSEALRGKHDAVAELLRAKGGVMGVIGDKVMASPE